jgi:ribosomal-protein-alanine N-acetyltransferase
MRIETPRLLVRSLMVSDAGPLATLWADPEVTRYMGGPRNRDDIRVSLEEDAALTPTEKDDLWPVIEKATGTVIGHCGLLDKEVDGQDEVELVYVLARSAWGKGYATEAAQALRGYAFGALGLKRIISLIEPDNAPSERVATKVGMRLEKETVRPGGRLMRVYAVSADEINVA